MAKKRQRSVLSDEPVELDMTPMIDIVFQMILFFVIITDFTQKDIALLKLPWSTVGIEDEGQDEKRLIINITAPKLLNDKPGNESQYSKILIRGQEYNFMELQTFLEANGRGNP
ncbi:MAG: biopolymer transporter ExbD, partial [Planctomycetes bacterium]|nr:biopolymer transporter ExbD [Planctomycetota bacterium]